MPSHSHSSSSSSISVHTHLDVLSRSPSRSRSRSRSRNSARPISRQPSVAGSLESDVTLVIEEYDYGTSCSYDENSPRSSNQSPIERIASQTALALGRSRIALAAALLVHAFMFSTNSLVQFVRRSLSWCLGIRETCMASPLDNKTFRYFPPAPHDSRSPCPALNMLANHGYLPRDGLDISRKELIYALQRGFRLSFPLAWIVTYGGYILTGQFRMMSLGDLCRHNGVEHNASLVHRDALKGHEYAPAKFDDAMFKAMEYDMSNCEGQFDLNDFARTRNRRERESGEPDLLHAEIARGEVALTLDIFGGVDRKIDLGRLHQMWAEERFPDDWSPSHEQTLARTALMAQELKQRMIAFRTGKPYHENKIQKWIKTYMIWCEPPHREG